MRVAVAAVNHLLEQNPWARERLAAYAGMCFALDPFPLPRLSFTLTAEGRVTEPGGQAPDAVLAASPDALLRYLLVTPHDLHLIRIHGHHAFGEAVAEVLAGLEWEAEEDLSRLCGDVLAHRIATFARNFWQWRAESVLKLAQAFTEYLTEERPLLAKRDALTGFAAEVEELAAAVDRLEARIARLSLPA